MANSKIVYKSSWLWIAIIAAVTLIIFAAVFGYLSFLATERAVVKEFNSRQISLARESATGIELYFDTIASEIRSVADNPVIENNNKNKSQESILLKDAFNEVKPLGANDIGIINSQGILVSNVNAPAIKGKNFSFRKYFKDAKKSKSKSAYFIDFIDFKGVKPGDRGAAVAIPVFKTVGNNTRVFNGVVVATVELSMATKRFIAPIGKQSNTEAYLIDDRFNVLWDPAKTIFGKNLFKLAGDFPSFKKVLVKMAAGQSGGGEYKYFRYDEKTGKYTKMVEDILIGYTEVHPGNARWSIGVWSPKQKALSLISSAVFRLMILVVGIIFAILVAVTYAFVIRVKTEQHLENQVKERTAELKAINVQLNNEIIHRNKAQKAIKQKDIEIRQAYEDIFSAVSGGKLILTTEDEINRLLGKLIFNLKEITGYDELSSARRDIKTVIKKYFPKLNNLDDIALAASEALTNAIKHAKSGCYGIYKTVDTAQILISDHGPGINFKSLPRATLLSGYSTKRTLGIGFDIMLEYSSRLLLTTQPGVTIIVLEFYENKNKPYS